MGNCEAGGAAEGLHRREAARDLMVVGQLVEVERFDEPHQVGGVLTPAALLSAERGLDVLCEPEHPAGGGGLNSGDVLGGAVIVLDLAGVAVGEDERVDVQLVEEPDVVGEVLASAAVEDAYVEGVWVDAAAIEESARGGHVILSLAEDRLRGEEDFGIAAAAQLLGELLVGEVQRGGGSVGV
jgi:hypothetical protein